MGAQMDKVKRLVEAGASLSGAVREALAPRSLADVATDQGVDKTTLYQVVNGRLIASQKIVDAIVAELGGTADEWRTLFAAEQQKRALAPTS